MRRTFKKLLNIFENLDFFAYPVRLRYKSQGDYKTATTAIISLMLIGFFAYTFITQFIILVNLNKITSTQSQTEETDPSDIKTSTDEYMFAIGINSIDLSSNFSYFNIKAYQASVLNGVKQPYVNINLQPCTRDQWARFGPQFGNSYDKLSLSQWLCPVDGTNMELRGKYSSDIFQYVKIGVSNCTASPGITCAQDSDFQTLLSTVETFQLNYYFINTLINSDNREPVSTFLDDTNYAPFNFNIGAIANLYLQHYQIKTDYSLFPFYQDPRKQQGLIVSNSATLTVFPPNSLITQQYMKFYVRKSPASLKIDRTFFTFDQLLAYMGGLFGIIALLLNIPLFYYNSLSFELSLATEMYTYRQEKQKKLMQSNGQTDINLTTTKKQEDEQPPTSQPFSIHNFNFFWYLLYLPFHFCKYMGWQSLHSKKFSPFYEAVIQTRKQIDLCKSLKNFTYMDKMSKTIFDEDQQKLLHCYPKQQLHQVAKKRRKYKLHTKLATHESIHSIQDLENHQNHQNELDRMSVVRFKQIQKTLAIVKKRRDKLSKRIIRNIDPQILKKFGEHELLNLRILQRSDDQIKMDELYHRKKPIHHQQIQAGFDVDIKK